MVLKQGLKRYKQKDLVQEGWVPYVGCVSIGNCVNEVWVIIVGLPMHFQNKRFFFKKKLRDAYVGFVIVDENIAKGAC